MENEDQLFNNELNAIAKFHSEQLTRPIKDYFIIKDGEPFFNGDLDVEIMELIINAHSKAYRR